nr:hypothetical protein [Paenibacillus bovis]
MRKLCTFLQDELNLAGATIILAESARFLADVSCFLAIRSYILADTVHTFCRMNLILRIHQLFLRNLLVFLRMGAAFLR